MSYEFTPPEFVDGVRDRENNIRGVDGESKDGICKKF